jgi:excinuclease ABC subunit C
MLSSIVMALTEELIKSLPKATGVYILRDPSSKIIYIGKAKDLRTRVRSYLKGDNRLQTGRIVDATQQVDYILTNNESEALLLENQLIKAHKPRYNIDLKDDKTYVRIKVTTHAEWPSISITRKVTSDGSRYFGPYSSAQATRNTLSAIGRIFPIRRCKDTEFANRTRPCIYHAIGLCLAPCVYKTVRKEYDQAVADLVAFLEGRDKELGKLLQGRMLKESEGLNFEKAARIRDQIEAISITLVPQVIVGQGRGDTNVFATFRSHNHVQVAVLQIAKGTLTDSRNILVKEAAETDLMTTVMLQFYLAGNEIPGQVFTDTLPQDRHMLEEVLGTLKGSLVKITKPSRGKPLQWLAMAQVNARTHARGSDTSALEEIAKAFHLGSIPYRMECYDISNLQGGSSTGSRVVFMDGEPDKTLYRHYRIRTIIGQDDFAMLREVFERRLNRDETRPDLIVIDGGKGQLGVFLKVLEDLGVPKIPLVSMAKAHGSKVDRFFLPGRKDAIRLPERSVGLRTLQRLRDEAHRFAVKYHRQLRSRITASMFENIPGIGPKKARTLLMHTSHISDPSRITPADLEGIKGLSKKDIANVISFLVKD